LVAFTGTKGWRQLKPPIDTLSKSVEVVDIRKREEEEEKDEGKEEEEDVDEGGTSFA
jgi:hypothetical protein